jgi:hypothetical protein
LNRRGLRTEEGRLYGPGIFDMKVTGDINRGPLERTEGVVKLYQRSRQVAACLGFELGEQGVGGVSDGNFVAALDVPVLDGLGGWRWRTRCARACLDLRYRSTRRSAGGINRPVQ